MKYRVRLEGLSGVPIEVDVPEVTPLLPALVEVNGRTVEVLLLPGIDGETVLMIEGRRHPLRELTPLAPGGKDAGSPASASEVRFLHRGRPVLAQVETEADLIVRRSFRPPEGPSAPFLVHSPLPGIVRRVLVAPGDLVEASTPLLTLEAMKMENEVRAERTGRVAEVLVEPGRLVNAGEPLARIEPL